MRSMTDEVCPVAQTLINQLQPAKARVSVAAYDNMIVQRNPKRLGDVLQIVGHADIGVGRRGVARGVIVHEDQSLS